MNKIKEGSIWRSDREEFQVISLAEIDDHVWVYYRKLNTDPPLEYSCYIESFLDRFTPTP